MAGLLDAIFKGIVSRSLPQGNPDGRDLEVRQGRHGEVQALVVMPDYYQLADEGTYFIGTTPISSGQAFGSAASISFQDTVAALMIQNGEQQPSGSIGKRLYLDYIKLICTTAIVGTTTPFWQLAGRVDNAIQRYTSGGTQITPVNANMDVGTASLAKLFTGSLVLAAGSGSARTVFRQPGRGATVMPGINDVIVINFGGVEKAVGAQAIAAAIPVELTFNAPPVVLGPQHTFTLHAWSVGQSAAAVMEIEMGWWER